ncbi:hypothetical protein K431DRAFT_17040 [Polychaeton citri CBS 116435]|uniref:ADF-H domain-containing protein n=1 Tax=Polychaeton citri CBS 116435 TaxID=1314669 RepID=A0A9P4QAN5_9PEZI|nr:hypothetical protein K431DRAFT_17040 [Polychaeton citri CBS 116435]
MSLNGLDAPAVQDSYQTAVIEAGGWFLLKYVSRDSVELLSRGKGGVHECRNAISKYEDLSPLYGLIIYRRRKVLIKFIPGGTSRLLQARTAVHFSDVLERYSPYETLLEITTADGLNDTSLAASFPLHTASPAASQSRLHEISEDGEEGGGGGGQYSLPPRPTTFQTLSSAGAIFGTQRYKAERRADQLMGPDKQSSSPQRSSSFDRSFPLSSTTSPPPSIHVTDGNGSDVERFTSPYASPLGSPLGSVAPTLNLGSSVTNGVEGKQEHAIDSRAPGKPWSSRSSSLEGKSAAIEKHLSYDPGTGVPHEPATKGSTREPIAPSTASAPRHSTTSKRSDKSIDSDRTEIPTPTTTGLENGHSPESRRSTQRSSTSDRTSTATERPRWDMDQPYDFSYLEPKAKVKLGPRPAAVNEKPNATVAAIPSSIRPIPPKKEPRPKSQSALGMNGMGAVIPEPPPIPDIPAYNPRPLSRGSVKSLPSHKSGVGAMTPDKIRLMKAVELRKKQLRKSQGKEQAQKAAAIAAVLEETPSSTLQQEVVPEIPEIPRRSEARLLAKKTSNEGKPEQPDIARLSEDEVKSQNKADSGIEMEYERKSTERERQQRVEGIQHEESTRHKIEGQQSRPSSRDSAQGGKSSNPAEALAMNSTAEGELPLALEKAGSTAGNDTNTPAVMESKTGEPSVSPLDAVPKILMADGTRPMTSGREEGQKDHTSPKQDWQRETQQDSTRPSSFSSSAGGETDSSIANLAPVLQNPRRQNSDLARRRRGLVEPLQIDVPGSNTPATTPLTDGEHFLSDDDDFMEELQSATVQEAQPVTMSRTPTTQQHFDHIDRRPSAQSLVSAASNHSVKSILIPNRKSSATPVADGRESFGSDRTSPPRSTVATTSNSSPSSPESGIGLRRNVSSGISQRIQALSADVESSPPQQQQQTRDYFTQSRQNSFRSASAAAVARNSAYRQTKRWSGRMTSASSVPGVAGANGSDSSPMEQATPSWTVQHEGPASRNSVSVSARIIRSPSIRQQSDGISADGDVAGTPDGPSEFQHSDLVINRQRASYTGQQQGPIGGTTSIPTSPEFPPNPRLSTENPVYLPRTTSQFYSANHNSLGQKHGSAPTNREAVLMPTANDEYSSPPEPPASTQSSGRAASPVSHFSDDAPSVKEPAASTTSRASRFFKRMSNFGGNSKRKSLAQQYQQQQAYQSTSKPSSIVERPVGSGNDTPQPIVIGNLNVQFPDNLLWKRRWVEMDTAGNLVFSIPQAMDHQRGLARKFPIAQLSRPPYAPDLDRQELPHSIMLDFLDGTTLQAAAEDAVAYRQAIAALRSGYRQWAG